MDPRQPTKSTEEMIRDNGGSVASRETETPTQRVREVSSVSQTPGGQVTKKESMSGASPAAAHDYGRKKQLFHTYQLLWYLLSLLEIFLAFRFVLKLTGANPNSGFAQFVYGATTPFVSPFLGLFRAARGQGAETTAILEWSTIVAALVYALLVWGIVKLLQMGKPVEPDEVERTVQSQ